MAESYRVDLEKMQLVFSAAHFITFNGNVCERLHGHNYRVRVSVPGPLDENHYVIDFIALRDELQAIVNELDHHVLLPTDHSMIKVVADDLVRVFGRGRELEDLIQHATQADRKLAGDEAES